MSKLLMPNSKILVPTIAYLLLVVSTASAHPGHSARSIGDVSEDASRTSGTPLETPAARVWTSRHSAFAERGAFVMARDGVVQIRRADDSLATLTLASLSLDDQQYVGQRMARIRAASPRSFLTAQAPSRTPAAPAAQPPAIARHFDPFVQLKAIGTRWDARFFYVESNGIPKHPMMVGITSWQQQVPLPQKYVGDNAWRIPLHPVPAKTPALTKDRFLRGAIAVAVNGIPIFNPLNNRGDDAYLFGELDEYGGHCGRADDYHYHLAPVHLQSTVGQDQPIAYALDGYPIYGYQDPKAADYAPLDRLNGHKDAQGNYHYHATKAYPYLNGGFYGEVVERDGQVDPQPRAEPLRPALPPLRGARVTKFEQTSPTTHRLTYTIDGRPGTVTYTLRENGTAAFEFVDPTGKSTSETYAPRSRGPGGDRKEPPRGNEPPPPRDPPRDEPKKKGTKKGKNQPTPDNSANESRAPESRASAAPQRTSLTVFSTSVDRNGRLSVDCTCDGKGQSPAVAWTAGPAGTQAYVVSLWHTAPDQEKSYWLVYDIPPDVKQIASNAKPPGMIGLNDKRRAEFDPMCSKGPGLKTYHLTVYALSKKISLPPEKVTRATLRQAIHNTTLAEGTLDIQYER